MASIGFSTSITIQPALSAEPSALRPDFAPRPRDRYGSPS